MPPLRLLQHQVLLLQQLQLVAAAALLQGVQALLDARRRAPERPRRRRVPQEQAGEDAGGRLHGPPEPSATPPSCSAGSDPFHGSADISLFIPRRHRIALCPADGGGLVVVGYEPDFANCREQHPNPIFH
ncbi:Zinc finger protein [Musa troglodytarum]|uniref:Zinc finger protein n=1 Tax=Musa troglodytarum TaxID=320322 RepID=A0A9E7I9H4_9LILI|nr:Zinc finger protein [Musa troglodytarum]